MAKPTKIQWLTKAVGNARRSARFWVRGLIQQSDCGMSVTGIGPIRFPLKRTPGKVLLERCAVAPYGKGTRTLVNKRVRNTLELDPKEFRLSDDWNSAVAEATDFVAEQLGLEKGSLEPRLYKFLAYERGGFFLPHRDSEKQDRMVASMIVVLRQRFEGGELIIRHGNVTQTISFDRGSEGRFPQFAAFYADCEHEVRPVGSGIRFCLAYNLVQRQRPVRPTASPAPLKEFADAIRSWTSSQPRQPLVFVLEHQYTPASLSKDLLKGGDRQIAELVLSAAEMTDCVTYLTQVSRHLLQFADDGSFERGHFGRASTPRRKWIVGETYEDEIVGDRWVDLNGKRQPWGEIPLEPSAIVSSEPIDQWKPTTEDFEGYTGNAGNTLDRWYHRTALVAWHRDHHWDVVSRTGPQRSIPLFGAMVERLAKTPKKRFESARADLVSFAKAITDQWPRRASWRGYPDDSPCVDFPKYLLMLRDQETVARFLATVSERDNDLPLDTFIIAACKEFGWDTFAKELKLLVSSPVLDQGRDAIAIRDFQWFSAYCLEKSKAPERIALARELCTAFTERFLDSLQSAPAHYRPRASWAEPARAAKLLISLFKSLVATGREEDLTRVALGVQESKQLSLEACAVPCLESVVPWSQKRRGEVPAPLANWLASVRNQLAEATARKPEPPSDWRRSASVSCHCRYCTELNSFLADPDSETRRIRAREDLRLHLIDAIRRYACDVTHEVDRKGTPFSLVLTKTTGAYERDVQRFENNLRLLGRLPTLP